VLQIRGDFDDLLDRDNSRSPPPRQPPPGLGLRSRSSAIKAQESADSTASFASAASASPERSQNGAAGNHDDPSPGSTPSTDQAVLAGLPGSMPAHPGTALADDKTAEATCDPSPPALSAEHVNGSSTHSDAAEHAAGQPGQDASEASNHALEENGDVRLSGPSQTGASNPEAESAEPSADAAHAADAAPSSCAQEGHGSTAEPPQEPQEASGAAAVHTDPLQGADSPLVASHAAGVHVIHQRTEEGAHAAAGRLEGLSLQGRGPSPDAQPSGGAAAVAAEREAPAVRPAALLRGPEASAELPVSTLRMARCFSGYNSAEEEPAAVSGGLAGPGAEAGSVARDAGEAGADPLRHSWTEDSARAAAAGQDARSSRESEPFSSSKASGGPAEPDGEELSDLSAQSARGGAAAEPAQEDDERGGPPGFELQALGEQAGADLQPDAQRPGAGRGSNASMSAAADSEEAASLAGTSELACSPRGLDGMTTAGGCSPADVLLPWEGPQRPYITLARLCCVHTCANASHSSMQCSKYLRNSALCCCCHVTSLVGSHEPCHPPQVRRGRRPWRADRWRGWTRWGARPATRRRRRPARTARRGARSANTSSCSPMQVPWRAAGPCCSLPSEHSLVLMGACMQLLRAPHQRMRTIAHAPHGAMRAAAAHGCHQVEPLLGPACLPARASHACTR
jgi:hypothetical protein